MGSPSRNAVIIGVSLFLEACAFYLIFGLAGVVLGQTGPVLSFWLVLLALIWAYVLSLYVQTLKFTANLRGIVGLGVSIGSFIFLIALDAGFSLAPSGDGAGGSGFSAVSLALTIVYLLILWWRGGSLAQDRVDLDVVRRSFQMGMVVLVATILVQSLGSSQLVSGVLAVGFFAVGLPGLALARFSSGLGGAQQMPVDWWIPIVASVAAVLLLALLIAGAGLGGLDVVTRQLLGAVGEMGGWIIQPLTVGLGIIAGLLASLVSWVSGIFGGGDITGFEQAVGRIEQFQEDVRQEAGEGGPPQVLVDLIKWLAFLVAVSLVGWVVYRIFRVGAGRRSPAGVEESRESLFSWSKISQDLSASLSEWWRNLGGSKLRGRGANRDPRTPREFYHGLLVLAEGLGRPRLQWQTPREHQWDLGELLPAGPVACIVDGFQLSHYGDVQAGQTEIESLRREWQAIKQHLADQARARKAENRGRDGS